MGQEIHKAHFKDRDFSEFFHRLQAETKLLKQWFEDKAFETECSKCGFELEGCLIDKNFNPASKSEAFLKKINNPLAVPEVSQFNFEYNSLAHQISKDVLTGFHKELTQFWDKAQKVAAENQAKLISIGILPTLTQKDLHYKNFFPHKRYHALNERLKLMRKKDNIEIDIEGEEHLSIHHDNLLIEGVSTSLQMHLQLNASKAVRYYNTGIIAAAPMVAIAANSPFLFQKALWNETRIPVFEQAIKVDSSFNPQGKALERVTFGTKYVKDSIFELYEENLQYAVLLPDLLDEPSDHLGHLRIHNGTIWRWNRPIIDFNSQGVPHIRLEQRVAAAGTSAIDMVANIAFFLGFMRYYATCHTKTEEVLSFAQAKANFYQAAKYGLRAKVSWKGQKNIVLQDLILTELLPKAKLGLEKMDVDRNDIKFFLDELIKARVTTGLTGSEWQRQFIKNTSGVDRFQKLTEQYYLNQNQNIPVHEWN